MAEDLVVYIVQPVPNVQISVDKPVVVAEISRNTEVYTVELGTPGPAGKNGKDGKDGKDGANTEEIPDLTLIFENQLI